MTKNILEAETALVTGATSGIGKAVALETKGAKVTLICGNDSCGWKERTEFWSQYIVD